MPLTKTLHEDVERRNEPALILLPDIFGTPLNMKEMANQLTSEFQVLANRKVYGGFSTSAYNYIYNMQEPEVGSDDSIPAYVQSLVDSLKDKPEHEFIIFGYSWGGFLAHELIQQLGKHNKEVIQVVLLDSDLHLLLAAEQFYGIENFIQSISSLLEYNRKELLPKVLQRDNLQPSILPDCVTESEWNELRAHIMSLDVDETKKCLASVKLIFKKLSEKYEESYFNVNDEQQVEALQANLAYLQKVIQTNLQSLCHYQLPKLEATLDIPCTVLYPANNRYEQAHIDTGLGMTHFFTRPNVVEVEGVDHINLPKAQNITGPIEIAIKSTLEHREKVKKAINLVLTMLKDSTSQSFEQVMRFLGSMPNTNSAAIFANKSSLRRSLSHTLMSPRRDGGATSPRCDEATPSRESMVTPPLSVPG